MEAKPRWLSVLDTVTAGLMLIALAMVFLYAPEEVRYNAYFISMYRQVGLEC